MLPAWARETVTVKRPSYRESRGSKVADWTNPVSHEIRGCWFDAPSSAMDYNDASTPITYRATLYLPPGSDIAAGDKVVANEKEWRIDGEPNVLKSPFGRVSHIVCNLVEWGT